MKKILFVLILNLNGMLLFGVSSERTLNQGIEIISGRMESLLSINVFKFYDNVQVIGEGLKVLCDYMEVSTDKGNEASVNVKTPDPQLGSINQITVVGNVRIEQTGRIATCGRAEIFRQEGKIILTENPILVDNNGRIEGFRIILFKDENRAIVDPCPEGGRTKVILPALPDLGFKLGEPKKTNKNALSTNSEPSSINESSLSPKDEASNLKSKEN